MFYLILAIFVYVAFSIKNRKFINVAIGNEIVFREERPKQKISWLAVFVLIFISGFRAYSVGCDISLYKLYFDKMASTNNLYAGGAHFGLFYLILGRICSWIFSGNTAFTFLLFIISIFNILVVLFVAKEVSPDISTTMFLFVCMDIFIPSLSMLRQSIAVSFVILSLKFLNKKNPMQFLACIVLGSMFHESVIFLLGLYVFKFFASSKKLEIIFAISLIIFSLFMVFDEPIIKWVCIKFDFHYYWSYRMLGEKMSLMSNLKYIIFILAFLFFWSYKIYCDKKKIKLNKNYQICLCIYFVVALISIYNIISGRLLIISRMVYYFSWSIIFLAPMFLESIKNSKIKKICTILIIIAGLLYLSTAVVIRDQFLVLPYKTIFEC